MKNSQVQSLRTSLPQVVAPQYFISGLRSREIRLMENMAQERADYVAAKVEYESGPAYVVGKYLRKLYDQIFSSEQKKQQQMPPMRRMNVTEFQEEVDAIKKAANGAIADLSSLKDVIILPQKTNFGNTTIYAIEGLNVANTNFPQLFNLDQQYFRNCSFAGCPFADNIGTTFDGCDLSRADISNTTQTSVNFGADMASLQNLIQEIDEGLHHSFSSEVEQQMIYLQKCYAEVQSTKLCEANFEGAFLAGCQDNQLTDYSDARFHNATIEGTSQLKGVGLDLSNVSLKNSVQLENVDFKISDPLTAEEIASQSGQYVATMLRNNLVNQISGKKTVIAVASSLEENFDQINNRCVEIFGEGLGGYEVIKSSDLQRMVDLYTAEYGGRYNVEFVVDNPDRVVDFKLNICHSLQNSNIGGSAASVGLIGSDADIRFVGDSFDRDSTLLHERGHVFGSFHPFVAGVDVTKCSPFASVMCYNNALDIMFPVGNGTKPLTMGLPQDLGVQDHKFAIQLFGQNSSYVPHDITTSLSYDETRIICGDAGFNNTVVFNAADLPHDVKYVVLDAATSIGTCYEFPCDEQNLAAGIEGNLVVFYREDNSGNQQILGSTLVFGGKYNDIVVDGQKSEKSESTNWKAIVGGSVAALAVSVGIIAAYCKNRKQNREVVPQVPNAEVQEATGSSVQNRHYSAIGNIDADQGNSV